MGEKERKGERSIREAHINVTVHRETHKLDISMSYTETHKLDTPMSHTET